jgi:hypothetical protein
MNEYSVFHGLVGCFAVCVAIIAHVGPVPTAIIVLVLGLLHEVIDRDLFGPNFGYEGWKDALSFLFPGPFLYLLLSLTR